MGKPVWLTRFPELLPVSNILKDLSTTFIYLGSLNRWRELPQAHKSSQSSWLASDRGEGKHKPIRAEENKKDKGINCCFHYL